LGSIGLPELLILFFVIFGSIFWIWALIDCATNEPGGSEKIVWVLIILLGGCLGAPIYFFVRRPRRMEDVGR
jgi:hypothetical protein